MAIRRRTGLLVVAVAALFLLGLMFIGPVVLRVDRYRPELISYLQKKTGKQIEIGRLALTVFPVALHMDRFGTKNPPSFPVGYVFRASRIDAELSLSALLRRQVVITSLSLDEPILNMTSDPDGPWNSRIHKLSFHRTTSLSD